MGKRKRKNTLSSSDKQPYQMTSAEFYKAFPLFTELSPRVKLRLYRICNKENLRETGETGSYGDFVEAAVQFRWDVENATVLWSDDHSYYVKEALRLRDSVPDEVLAEYSELVEEFIKKRQQQQRLQEKRREKLVKEKTDDKFWKHFK